MITHHHIKAELEAIAITVAAYLASSQSIIAPQDYYQTLQKFVLDPTAELPNTETAAFLSIIEQVCISAEQNESGVTFPTKLAKNLEENRSQSPLPLAIYLIPCRNIMFILVILFHAFYRLLPPY